MIHVSNLSKTFGDLKAVDGVSFDVPAGEIFAFLGPNGAGKTTTIQMLTTLLRPTAGRSRSTARSGAPTDEVRRRFGIVFQDPSLDQELTAWENMDLHGVLYHVPRRVRTERIRALLTLFELWERRDAFVKTFSGGMKRRLEIARGFLHTPKILFLDEPTLGLDPQSRNQLWTHCEAPERDRAGDRVPDHALHGRGRPRGAPRGRHRSRRIVAQGTSTELKARPGPKRWKRRS
jgi:ABC-2 type transport system ATP-binding protein